MSDLHQPSASTSQPRGTGSDVGHGGSGGQQRQQQQQAPSYQQGKGSGDRYGGSEYGGSSGSSGSGGSSSSMGGGSDRDRSTEQRKEVCKHIIASRGSGSGDLAKGGPTGPIPMTPLAEVFHTATVRDALCLRDRGYGPRPESASSSTLGGGSGGGGALTSAWQSVASAASKLVDTVKGSTGPETHGTSGFPGPKKLVWVYANDSIESAMEQLRTNKILAAPVVNRDRIVGFVDMLDISNFVLSSAVVDPAKAESMDLKQLNFLARKISEAPVTEAMGIGGETAMAVSDNDILAHEAHVFTKQGVHRVAVYDSSTKQVSSMLTQTDLVRFITHQLESNPKLKEVANKKMKDFGYTGKAFRLIKIAGNASVLQAVQRLAATRVSGLAVVNPKTGRLIGNFSATDLKGLFADQFPLLVKPVSDFLDDHSPDSMRPIIEPLETRSLLDTCKCMLANRVHRLWMVDEEYRPINVVTMTDIIRIAAGPTD